MKKIILLLISLFLFLFICFFISSNSIKKNYINYKEKISFEKNLKFDLNNLLTIDSTKVDSKIFVDKITLIQFSFNGCGPCRKAKKRFPRLLNKTNDKFQIVTISIDKFSFWKQQNKDKIYKDWKKINIGNSQLIKTLEIKGYPTYFILNEKGEIISRPSWSTGINAIRNYLKIEPNKIDLLIEHFRNLQDSKRFWNLIKNCTLLYLAILGLVILVKFIIKKYVRQHRA